MKMMEQIELPSVEELLFMVYREGTKLLACSLNVPLFGMTNADFVEGVELASPATYYKNIVIQSDMNLTF